MPKVTVEAELSEEHLRAYQAEARRQGVAVEALVEQTVNALIKELEREVRELRQANEILRKASAYFAQAELDRRPKK